MSCPAYYRVMFHYAGDCDIEFDEVPYFDFDECMNRCREKLFERGVDFAYPVASSI